MSGKTFGIIGFGYVGTNLAKLLTGFNTTTLVYDIINLTAEEQNKYKVKQVSFEDLLKQSDIISLNLPKKMRKLFM